MLDDQRPIYLIGEDSQQVQQATLQLYRIGLDRVEGYLRNGMTDWQNAGLPLARVEQWTVHELEARRDDPQVQVLDVRSPEEVAQGRVPGAEHAFVATCPTGWGSWTAAGPWRPTAAAATAHRSPRASSSAKASATW